MSSFVFAVEQQVIVLAPHSQAIHLLPVGQLVVVLDEANHSGVVRELDVGVGAMFRSPVVGEEGVEEQTQHTALKYIDAYGEGGGAVVA